MVARLCWRGVVPRWLSSHSRLSRFKALQICSIVSSGFFPPEPLGVPGDETQHQQAQRLVPHQRRVVPPLVVREAEFALAHPEGVFHIPAAESDPQQRLYFGVGWRIGQEVLLLARLRVLRPDQPVRPCAPLPVLHLPDLRRLHLPDLLPYRLARQLYLDPRLFQEARTVPHHLIGTLPLALLTRPLRRAVGCHAGQALGYFAHETQVSLIQSADELRSLAVFLVKGDPVEIQLIGFGSVQLLQGDLPLGPVFHVIGDARRPVAFAVFGPILREEQFGIDQGLVAALADAEVHGDDAVVELADTAEVLALDAGGLVAGLQGRGLVDQTDVAQAIIGQARQFDPDVALQLLTCLSVLPLVVAEELLQGTDGTACSLGDRLDRK